MAYLFYCSVCVVPSQISRYFSVNRLVSVSLAPHLSTYDLRFRVAEISAWLIERERLLQATIKSMQKYAWNSATRRVDLGFLNPVRFSLEFQSIKMPIHQLHTLISNMGIRKMNESRKYLYVATRYIMYEDDGLGVSHTQFFYLLK